MKQLSQDMSLSADDVKFLMDKVMSDDATISVKGESIYNTQVHQHHLKYLEKQIFSGLAGVSLPTKVCLSKQNLCIYIDEMSHTLTLPLYYSQTLSFSLSLSHTNTLSLSLISSHKL